MSKNDCLRQNFATASTTTEAAIGIALTDEFGLLEFESVGLGSDRGSQHRAEGGGDRHGQGTKKECFHVCLIVKRSASLFGNLT